MHDAGLRVHAAFGQTCGATGVGQAGLNQCVSRSARAGILASHCVSQSCTLSALHGWQRMLRQQPIMPSRWRRIVTLQ